MWRPPVARIPSKASLLALAIVLAGCSQAPVDTPEPLQGGVRGVVVSEALVPLVGAEVRIVHGNSSIVADDGTYRIRSDYDAVTVVASAPGYEQSTRNVDLRAGEWIVVDFVLRAIDDVRYHDTQVFKGLIECGAIVQYGHTHGNGDPDDDNRILCPGNTGRDHVFEYIPDRNPQDLLIEVFWKPNNEYAEVLTVVLRDADGEFIHFEEGPSPLRLELAAKRTQHEFGSDGTAIIEILPGIPSKSTAEVYAGVHIDQEFDMYVTSFHGMNQPMHWTVDG